MNNVEPLINGVRHSWSSISVNFYGKTLTGITSISYEEERKIEDHYGAGSNVGFRGFGNRSAKASIGLAKFEVETLQKIAPGGDITRLPMVDIPVVYLPEGSDVLKTDVIRNAQITMNKRDVKQGDTKIETVYNLICSHIDWAKS